MYISIPAEEVPLLENWSFSFVIRPCFRVVKFDLITIAELPGMFSPLLRSPPPTFYDDTPSQRLFMIFHDSNPPPIYKLTQSTYLSSPHTHLRLWNNVLTI